MPITNGIKAFYNDNDPFICAWLHNLIAAGLITPGVVDERPIQELTASDLAGFERVHLFAGIAGWDHALNLAGWGDHPVWTGSCPCQPFSAAGKRQAEADPRHLWPAWFRLIRECRPPVVLGEQVASAIGHGWLDLVFDDLEREGYACGAAVLPACSVGAPHLRQRLWFVAESEGSRGWTNLRAIRAGTDTRLRNAQGQDERRPLIKAGRAFDSSPIGELGHALSARQRSSTSSDGSTRGANR